MKAKEYQLWVLLAAGIFTVTCWAAVNKFDHPSLAGLQGVYVKVQNLGPEAEKYGLTRQALLTDAQLLLRQNGIKVLSQQEGLQAEGRPYLYIYVNPIIHEEVGIATVNISVQFRQDVRLVREPTIVSPGATTWHIDTVLHIDLNYLKNTRERVKDSVDRFINDYLAANPKEQKIDNTVH